MRYIHTIEYYVVINRNKLLIISNNMDKSQNNNGECKYSDKKYLYSMVSFI